MASSKWSKKLSGSQFADPFILSKGRTVIKDFDADDGDFIGVPANSKFKLLKRKDGVLIKGKGFRTMVRGAIIAELERNLKEVNPLPSWDDYITGEVTVSESNGWLIFSGDGEVEAPESEYRGWKKIQINDVVSFPGDGMILDKNNATINIVQNGDIGDIKIDGGSGKDTVIVSSRSQHVPHIKDGSIKPSNIEVFRLATEGRGGDGPNGFEITGNHRKMSVEIYASSGGGIAIDSSTRLKNIKVVMNPDLVAYGTDHSFVRVMNGDTIDFKKAFTDEKAKLLIDPVSGFDKADTDKWGNKTYGFNKAPFLLEGDYVNAQFDDIVVNSKDVEWFLRTGGFQKKYGTENEWQAVIDYERFRNTGSTQHYPTYQVDKNKPQDYCPYVVMTVFPGEKVESLSATELFSGSDINLQNWEIQPDWFAKCPDVFAA